MLVYVRKGRKLTFTRTRTRVSKCRIGLPNILSDPQIHILYLKYSHVPSLLLVSIAPRPPLRGLLLRRRD